MLHRRRRWETTLVFYQENHTDRNYNAVEKIISVDDPFQLEGAQRLTILIIIMLQIKALEISSCWCLHAENKAPNCKDRIIVGTRNVKACTWKYQNRAKDEMNWLPIDIIGINKIKWSEIRQSEDHIGKIKNKEGTVQLSKLERIYNSKDNNLAPCS